MDDDVADCSTEMICKDGSEDTENCDELVPKQSCEIGQETNQKVLDTDIQSASTARSQGLLESFCVSSSGNFLLAWRHNSCSMAHWPGELQQQVTNGYQPSTARILSDIRLREMHPMSIIPMMSNPTI